MPNQEQEQQGPIRPLYPASVVHPDEVPGDKVYSFGRLFVRGKDGRWLLIEFADD